MSSFFLTPEQTFAFSGSFDIFAVFSPANTAQSCEQAIREWIINASTKNPEKALFNRVISNIDFSKHEKKLLKKMRKNYVPDTSHNFEYFRVFVDESYLSEPVIMYSSSRYSILRIRGSLDKRIRLAVNPIVRFLYQFPGYIGIVSDDMANYSKTGKCLANPQIEKVHGMRHAENLLLELLQTKKDYAEGELQFLTLIITRYKYITSPIKKKNPLFAAICASTLDLDLKLIALEKITDLNLLSSLLEDAALSQFARKRLKEVLSTKGVVDQDKYLHPRPVPPLDFDTVQSILLQHYDGIERVERLAYKLAKIMLRVRRNTYSQRCSAPDEYVAVMCQSVSVGNTFDIVVLPGQDPYETIRVRTSRDIRDIYEEGTYFVVWLPEIPKKYDGYYISHSNTLLPISFNY